MSMRAEDGARDEAELGEAFLDRRSAEAGIDQKAIPRRSRRADVGVRAVGLVDDLPDGARLALEASSDHSVHSAHEDRLRRDVRAPLRREEVDDVKDVVSS